MVPADHAFRKLNKVVDFRKLAKPLRHLYSPIGEPGINVEKGIRCLIVQYWEDYSDRQMEHAVRENNAVRYFTGFKLTESTPDHSYFGKLRKRLGTNCGKSGTELLRRERKHSITSTLKITPLIKKPGGEPRARITSGSVISCINAWICDMA